MLYNSPEVTDSGLDELQTLASEQYCYLTTTGRKSGNRHTIEIWFAIPLDPVPGAHTLYMLSGGRDRSDWVRNVQNDPQVEVRFSNRTFKGRGRIVQDPEEEQTARKLVVLKYYGRDHLASTGWEAESLPVALDLEA
jgi:deazaflavin-dependent oxidoreductase (nitroreductase family)